MRLRHPQFDWAEIPDRIARGAGTGEGLNVLVVNASVLNDTELDATIFGGLRIPFGERFSFAFSYRDQA